VTIGVQDAFEVLFGFAIEVEREVVHPGFGDGFLFTNDIMLLKLAEPSDQPYIQLNFEEDVPNVDDRLWVIGFGDTEALSFIDNYSFFLKEVDLGYLPFEECDLAYGYNLIEETNLCTTSTDGYQSPWYVLPTTAPVLGCIRSHYGYIHWNHQSLTKQALISLALASTSTS
jgi:hypothetical protein